MGNLGKGSRVVPEQPLWLSLGSWWHPPAGQPGAASRLSTGLVRRPFQGKILFLVQLPPGPLELLTILFSICKSLNAEPCHPESDSVGWRSLSRQGLSRRSQLSSRAAARLGAARKAGNAAPHLPRRAVGGLDVRELVAVLRGHCRRVKYYVSFCHPEFPWWQH